MTVVITQDGDTADLIVWRHMGATEALTEALLDINPGLAAAGPVLPAGLRVTLPEPVRAVTQPMRLWS